MFRDRTEAMLDRRGPEPEPGPGPVLTLVPSVEFVGAAEQPY